jgi:hypothetical protein
LVTFPNPDTGEVKTLFTKRQVKTIEFKLNPDEHDFYFALTDYVDEQSVKAAGDDTARGRALGFTMAMLQRRFASSIFAVRRSLERMKEKREEILEDPEAYRQAQIFRRVPDDFDDLTEEEQEQILDDLEEVVASVDPVSLRDEIIKLGRLIDQAKALEAKEIESKLVKLKEVITDQGLFEDKKMKLLIFTEHKDTLYYLAGDGKGGRPLGKLREWGLDVTQIYGGMKIGDRDTPGTRIYAEREFKETCQVMTATEAAGEGINLQFCWLMINYDIPWNPVRLEQRMGRIHRYGQEKDCLIFNFVSTSTREGRVLQKLFERIAQIELDLDPKQTGKVFNVLGDVFPANQLEKMVREMYAHNLTEAVIKNRIVEQVDTDRFRQITHSALEGLAKRELNLAAIVGKSAEARERRLVPEVIEDFFIQAGPVAGIQPRETRPGDHIYRLGRVPRSLWPLGERLEPQFGRLGREYKQIIFDKKLLTDDPTLEWITPGHPLFETVRAAVQEQTQPDLQRGAIFYDLNRTEAASLTIFSAGIKDGQGRTLERRLFVVEVGLDGAMAVRQPTLFLDLIPAPAHVPPPDGAQPSPGQDQLEHFLHQTALSPLLQEVTQQRTKEADTVARHVEISLNALIDRVQVQFAKLLEQKVSGSTESGLDGRLKQAEERLEELNERLERRRRELQQERQCTVSDIRVHGRAWVLPHPERHTPGLAPMVRDEEIERIAVRAVTEYEQARGWQVVSVEAENKGFDLISRHFHPEDAQTAIGVRFIEVKGRAGVGEVALSSHEYKTAVRLQKDYWLYVVYNCAATPEVLVIRDPAQLGWEPLGQVAHFRLGPQAIKTEAERQRRAAPSLIEQAFQQVWQDILGELGQYNILVEGLSDKVYLELAAQRYSEAHGIDLLAGVDGPVRIVAGHGTKRHAPYFGMLQSLESQGIKYVALLDGDEPGQVAAEAMGKFGAQKNRHYFHLERPDYKDKAGVSWPVEIEDMLAWPLLESFINQHPEAVEERFQRGAVQKVVINGKPSERDGQTFDYKMMLTDHVRQRASVDDLMMLVELVMKARKYMGLKEQ